MKTSTGIYQVFSVKSLFYLLLLISIVSSVLVLYQFSWSGFGQDSNKSKSIETTIKDGKIISVKKTETEHFQSGKTLWDWLGLGGTLAIPIVLFQFQSNEQRRAEKRVKVEKEQAEELAKVEKEQAEKREKFEKDIAEANLREEAFQDYIDRMAAILINKTSRDELFIGKDGSNSKDNSVRDVARIRTVTILRRLENDMERQNRILHFLQDTELLPFILQTANFSGINLNGIKLNGVSLNGTNFTDANLSGANLSEANINGANFTDANLSGANLSEANINGANFTDANLSGANLENSYIQDTKFTNADLSNARLVNANTWDEEMIDNNFEFVYDDECDPQYNGYERWYSTNFSGAKLTNTNLRFTNLKAVKDLTLEQIKEGKNWDEAIYNSKFLKKIRIAKTITRHHRYNA
ncbi:pentapeptide repeat-containing protein [Calothrix sp. PCC 6303]|uniref:pentapeptide repeat-containing protein n=1 Tax=Calothrix sp. PCC 6303 TaxID=1170562 RepID=UPI0002A049FE|nr:pentapeptide repeat-containing protein [Calothrix sp. PCC 6303]AFZ00145.1 pentapeptide repeat protein [Calothrix sp. PCC 6303]